MSIVRGALPCILLTTLLLPACGGRSRDTPPPGAVLEAGGPGPKLDRGVIMPDPDIFVTPDKDIDVPPKKDIDVPPKNDKGPTPVCAKLGEQCALSRPCCGGYPCVALSSGPSLCLAKCTPDNPQTPLINEDDCPSKAGIGWACGDSSYPGAAKKNHCFKKCDPKLGSTSCPAGIACHPRSATFSGNINGAVCAYPACSKNRDCPVWLDKTCTTQGSASQCSGLPAGALCTRYSSGSGGNTPLRCALAGKCDLKSGLCAPHPYGLGKAKVGGPCQDDRGCGGSMHCDMQRSNDLGFIHARNGYCSIAGCAFSKTLTQAACPGGSFCNKLYYGGLCHKGCDLLKAALCRGYSKDKRGDYECRAWNYLSIGGVALVDQPVCEPGDSMKCDLFQGSSLDCSSIGLQNNPTKMLCRHPTTGAPLTNKYDPKGYCLDTTRSGP